MKMKKLPDENLKRVIESQHGGKAAYRDSVRLVSGRPRPDEWDGWVHMFDLRSNPNSQMAYAWSAPIKGGAGPRYFAVLRSAEISDPVLAVKAVAALIRQG